MRQVLFVVCLVTGFFAAACNSCGSEEKPDAAKSKPDAAATDAANRDTVGEDLSLADAGTADLGSFDSSLLDTGSTICQLEQAATPWPSWVPPWPGHGRNASGRSTFQFLDEGSGITHLEIEQLNHNSMIVSFTTYGDCASRIAWGTHGNSCPVGYRRTGARKNHRMLVAPLLPETEYHIVVQSQDGNSTDNETISATTPAAPAVTLLDGCGEIDTPGDYRLTTDVSAECTCFSINANNVQLDLGWNSVTYATTTSNQQCHGVRASGDSIVVSRGIVEQGAGGGDLYSHALAGRSSNGLTFEQIWLRVHSADAFGLRTMYSQNVVARDLLVVSEITQVTDRHYPGNRAISLDLSPEDASGEIYDNIVFGAPHWGISMTADDRLSQRPAGGQTRFVYNNHIFADMHATNGYALGVHANHMEVHHNEVRPPHNGRALHYTRSNGHIHHNILEALERIAGDPAEGFAHYSDLADPHSPHDPSVCSWVVAHGIRVEGGNFGHIERNEVYVYSVPNVSFGSTALNINTGSGAQGGNQVNHNQFTAHLAPGTSSCNGGTMHTVAGWVRGETPVEPADLHHNIFSSNSDTLDIENTSLATSNNDQLNSY